MQYPWLRRTVRNQKTHSCSKFQCSIYEMSMLKLLRLKILKLVVLLRAEIFMRRVIRFGEICWRLMIDIDTIVMMIEDKILSIAGSSGRSTGDNK